MEELAITVCMATLLVIAMLCAIVFKKLRMPAIIGYLAAGIIIANYWNLYDDDTLELIIELLSNLGLVLLMYAIGMELNLEKVKRSGAFAMYAVLIQLPILLAAGFLLGSINGWDFTLSLSLGAVMAGSSTAVVVVVQKEKKVMSEDSINTMLLVLVMEDIVQVILLSILTPMIESSSMDPWEVVFLVVKIVLFIVLSMIIGLRFLPRIIDWIGTNMSKEILILSSLAMCFIFAAMAVEIGLSMAVGAFLIGVITSQSKHCIQIEGGITPLKDIFMTMFFISVGLKVNPNELVSNIPLMLAILVVFIAARVVAGFLGYYLANKDGYLSFMSATGRVCMGEFAFIISALAFDSGLMSDSIYSAIIGAALVSMVLQPFITSASNPVFEKLTRNPPDLLRKYNLILNKYRQRAYDRFVNLPQRAHGLRMTITKAYFNALVAIVLFVVFCLFQTEILDIANNLDLDISAHGFIMLTEVIESIILLVPLTLAVSGAFMLHRHLLSANAPKDDRYLGYLMHSVKPQYVIVAFWIDLIMIFFIPNELGALNDILCACGGIAVFLAVWWIYTVHRQKHPKIVDSPPADDAADVDDDEPSDDSDLYEEERISEDGEKDEFP